MICKTLALVLALTVVGTAQCEVDEPAVDTKPLSSVKVALAFENLKFTHWQAEDADGKLRMLRPIVLTHAGDGSNRIFVATQYGTIHAFANRPDVAETSVFLDIADRVTYSDKQNEEGFLGLAFHPKFKENGKFYVYYTSKKAPQLSTISCFRTKAGTADAADPASEEIIMTIKQPYWNHNGGTLCFGPDGYLYIALGDGGAGNDPHNNGQTLSNVLGKILRIDVDRQAEPNRYAIPPDNPFVGRKDARPEIWAYGLRNVWRMAFDRKTAKLWAADVGQELWEEIDIIEKGGNYGWRQREGKHPFGKDGAQARPELIDPVWEYSHFVGKSITGGGVYRGKQVPALDGAYLYADYVSGKMWALWYDEQRRVVAANREIRRGNIPVLSFGEDEAGEVYFLALSGANHGIHRFELKR